MKIMGSMVLGYSLIILIITYGYEKYRPLNGGAELEPELSATFEAASHGQDRLKKPMSQSWAPTIAGAIRPSVSPTKYRKNPVKSRASSGEEVSVARGKKPTVSPTKWPSVSPTNNWKNPANSTTSTANTVSVPSGGLAQSYWAQVSPRYEKPKGIVVDKTRFKGPCLTPCSQTVSDSVILTGIVVQMAIQKSKSLNLKGQLAVGNGRDLPVVYLK